MTKYITLYIILLYISFIAFIWEMIDGFKNFLDNDASQYNLFNKKYFYDR